MNGKDHNISKLERQFFFFFFFFCKTASLTLRLFHGIEYYFIAHVMWLMCNCKSSFGTFSLWVCLLSVIVNNK